MTFTKAEHNAMIIDITNEIERLERDLDVITCPKDYDEVCIYIEELRKDLKRIEKCI